MAIYIRFSDERFIASALFEMETSVMLA